MTGKSKPTKAATTRAKKGQDSEATKKGSRKPSSGKNKGKPETDSEVKPVRIVAIGASAGGLEPIEQFFDAMPIDTGMAFVVVQHLSPNFQSMMDQLIERRTDMKVLHAEDNMPIEPNVIYLNPARTALSIYDGKLATKAYPDPEMLSLPIDAFFSSLAEENAEDAIGIVLSGTGSDGAKGSLAIVQNGGTVIAQDPSEAKFDSMPRKVIEVDAASYTAEVKDMPEILTAILAGTDVDRPAKEEEVEESVEGQILSILQKAYGTDFRYYKRTTVNRRIQRRSMLKRFRNLQHYMERLKNDTDELDTLYCDLLIGVTQFFRDKDAFEVLRNSILPDIASVMSLDRQIRIWVPGCATGEEAYSIAILISEFARRNGMSLNLKIFATDIHYKSLEIAANGVYSNESVTNIPPELLDTYFTQVESGYQVKQSLRRLIVFSPHNLIKDPPFTRIDLVSCRNLLIYFNDVAQQRVLSLFHFALRKNGILFLGSSETVGSLDDEFNTLDKRWRIFSKARDVQLREAAFLLPPEHKAKSKDGLILRETRNNSMMSSKKESHVRQALYNAYDKLLDQYAPACLLVSKMGELVHVFGDADQFLQVRKGVFSNRVVDLVHKELRLVINAGIERTLSSGTAHPFERSLRVELAPGEEEMVHVQIAPLGNLESGIEFLLITIQEKRAPQRMAVVTREHSDESDDQEFYIQRIAELESELKSTEESLQNTIEELETSNEELQATNEELMASNEELQSTNEELHSVNEELYTVSAEHQRKIAELTELTDDMENLLRSTQIGTVFLDEGQRIRRFTPAATLAFNLLPHDLGRPIGHVTYRFPQEAFLEEIDQVITTGKTINREVEIDGRTYMLTSLPYRTELDTMSGAVITVVDIQDLKSTQVHLDNEREFFKAIVDSQSDRISRFTPDFKLTFVNRSFCLYVGKSEEELLGSSYLDLFDTGSRAELMNVIERLKLHENQEWEREELHRDGSQVWLHSHFLALRNEDDDIIEIQAVSRNVTDIIERENLVRDFSAITANTSRTLEQKIEDTLHLVADHLGLSMALLVRMTGAEGVIEHIIGLEENVLSVGETHSIPNKACIENGCDPEKDLCFGNFADCRFGLHPVLNEIGYTNVIGAPIMIDGKLEGAITFAAPEAVPAPTRENIQSTVERIADWIGYEYFRRSHQVRLEELNERLLAEEERYRKLYMDAPVIMHSINQEGQIIEANDKWFETLGYERGEVIGKKSIDFLTEESRIKAVNEVVPAFWKHGVIHSVLYQMVKKNGDIIDVEMSATSNKDKDGNLVSMATIIDISDKLRAERELESQNRELKYTNDNLNQFTHIVSHDLAGPLRAVQHTAAWIEEDASEEARAGIQAHIDRLKDQIAHLGSLIADLTEYSRTSSAIPEPETINLRSSLEDIVEVIPSSEHFKIDLTIVPEEIYSYRAPLLLVLRNLLENAVKYHDKVDGNISVEVSDQKDKLTLFVIDDGPGIDPKYHSKILLPFRKLERKDKVPGNGMGLALVKKAVELVGGQIEIISDPSKKPGTTFKITWPKLDS